MRLPFRAFSLLCCLVSASACDSSPDETTLSLAAFHKDHEENNFFRTEPEESSPYGEVTRVNQGLTWFLVYDDLKLSPGQWVVDYRLAVADAVEPALELKAEVPEDCGEAATVAWEPGPGGVDVWQITDGVVFTLRRSCTVRLSLIHTDVYVGKTDWGLDWARVRRCDANAGVSCASGGE